MNENRQIYSRANRHSIVNRPWIFADVTRELNTLNVRLQGKNELISDIQGY